MRGSSNYYEYEGTVKVREQKSSETTADGTGFSWNWTVRTQEKKIQNDLPFFSRQSSPFLGLRPSADDSSAGLHVIPVSAGECLGA